MIRSDIVTSGSLSGSFSSLAFPNATTPTRQPNDAAPDKGRYQVNGHITFSHQVWVSGSNLNGTLSQQVSNNLAGWVTLTGSTQPIVGTSLAQDYIFAVPINPYAYARIMWSGSAGSGSVISISLAGNP